MKKSGSADLPLHYGKTPSWLFQRMARLGEAIMEALFLEYGPAEFLRRISDPHWFQALGCVMGMDWHSSGITTSVMGALKKASANLNREYGVYICGGRGKHSRQTPAELIAIAEKTGLDGPALVKASKLSAKVDNSALQDGFELYLHSFIVTDKGEWAVVQQGMNAASRMARRYHWRSEQIKSFVEEPHASVCGVNQGMILNLTHKEAGPTRTGIVKLTGENEQRIVKEASRLIMPRRHQVEAADIDLKRLGSILALARDTGAGDFESMLLLKGAGPKTIRSLTLVSEIIYGTPARFQDPARFSFAHGGKDGHPFPVLTRVYDQTVSTLKHSIEKAKLGFTDKKQALENLHTAAVKLEKNFQPSGGINRLVEAERKQAYKYGGRTVFGASRPPGKSGGQLSLFD